MFEDPDELFNPSLEAKLNFYDKLQDIIKRYDKEFDNDDIIDLETMQVIEDNGALKGQEERPFGSFMIFNGNGESDSDDESTLSSYDNDTEANVNLLEDNANLKEKQNIDIKQEILKGQREETPEDETDFWTVGLSAKRKKEFKQSEGTKKIKPTSKKHLETPKKTNAICNEKSADQENLEKVGDYQTSSKKIKNTAFNDTTTPVPDPKLMRHMELLAKIHTPLRSLRTV
ncbi:hypothetical protein O9G_002740 [Rozella allomycis CSF55]|uniref:Uncharacterized protein n=1 Tax=Rozella allomycis (strain CSF55) TaxID=988480 RepID=A0A075AVX1_ROZAC|nr:hypothetical protein O9G_002740 [Rozella allomycis CSF55]|eukprot:EPZ32654.1 hypothetical protein O9G_002740 [Rozella allomycis CSF55]